MTTTITRARDVLDHHVDLHDRLAKPSPYLKRYFSGFAQSVLETEGQGEPRARMQFYPYGAATADPATAGLFIGDLAKDLFDARTYQVTPEMLALAEVMFSKSFDSPERITLDEDELPASWGFIWLDQPWVHDDRHGKTVSTRAISWGTQNTNPVVVDSETGEARPGTATTGRGVRIVLWHYAGDPDDYVSEELEAQLTDGTGPLSMGHSETIPFGVPIGHDVLAMAYTLWSLMDMEITSVTSHTADRAATRRAQRSIRHGDVRVVALRRPRHAPTDGHRKVDWRVCWLVRGHRRHYREPLKDGRTSVWVRPYIKGPDGAPLKASDVLYRLER